MSLPPPEEDRLSPRDFQRLAVFIQDTAGIRMPPSKKTMMEGRLRRRARSLGLSGLEEYCRHLFDNGGLADEAVNLIDALTTNKTDFFREPEHFRLLVEHCLPEMVGRPDRPGIHRPLRVWSAAGSIGAEPYTLAMVLDDFGRSVRGFNFDILATDISTQVLAVAAHAVYPGDMAQAIPAEFQKRYLMRSRDRKAQKVRFKPHIRQMVHFGRLNLMEPVYPVGNPFDVIFCRNILIYFDKTRQEAVLSRLCENLRPNGYLFVGHTETVAGMNLPLNQIATSAFQKR